MLVKFLFDYISLLNYRHWRMLTFTSRVIAWTETWQRTKNFQGRHTQTEKGGGFVSLLSSIVWSPETTVFNTVKHILREKVKKTKIQTRGNRIQDARTSLSWITSATQSGNFKSQVPALGESFRDDQSLPPKPLEGTTASLQVQQKQFFAGEHCYLAWVPAAMAGFHWETMFYRKQGFLKPQLGTSLLVQRLELCLPMWGQGAVVQVWTLVGEIRSTYLGAKTPKYKAEAIL